MPDQEWTGLEPNKTTARNIGKTASPVVGEGGAEPNKTTANVGLSYNTTAIEIWFYKILLYWLKS